MSGRPRPGAEHRAASVSSGRRRRSRGRRCSAARRAAAPASPAGSRRARGRALGGGPARLAGHDDQPSSSASPSTAIRSSPSTTSNGTGLGPSCTAGHAVAPLERAPPEHERPAMLVLQLGSSASIRPPTATYRGSPASRARRPATPPRAASRPGSGRPERAPHGTQQPSSRRRAHDAGQDEEQGDHRAMIAAAGRAAARQGNGGSQADAGNQSPEGTYSTRGR